MTLDFEQFVVGPPQGEHRSVPEQDSLAVQGKFSQPDEQQGSPESTTQTWRQTQAWHGQPRVPVFSDPKRLEGCGNPRFGMRSLAGAGAFASTSENLAASTRMIIKW